MSKKPKQAPAKHEDAAAMAVNNISGGAIAMFDPIMQPKKKKLRAVVRRSPPKQ